jgi:hypothetical protein
MPVNSGGAGWHRRGLLTFPVFQFAAGFAVEEVEQVTRLRWRV